MWASEVGWKIHHPFCPPHPSIQDCSMLQQKNHCIVSAVGTIWPPDLQFIFIILEKQMRRKRQCSQLLASNPTYQWSGWIGIVITHYYLISQYKKRYHHTTIIIPWFSGYFSEIPSPLRPMSGQAAGRRRRRSANAWRAVSLHRNPPRKPCWNLVPRDFRNFWGARPQKIGGLSENFRNNMLTRGMVENSGKWWNIMEKREHWSYDWVKTVAKKPPIPLSMLEPSRGQLIGGIPGWLRARHTPARRAGAQRSPVPVHPGYVEAASKPRRKHGKTGAGYAAGELGDTSLFFCYLNLLERNKGRKEKSCDRKKWSKRNRVGGHPAYHAVPFGNGWQL